MNIQLNQLPTYDQRIIDKNVISRPWYNFWAGLFRGQPTGPAAAITVTASPFSYTAPQGGAVIVQGGTVSLIQLSRDGTTNYATGMTQGIVPVALGDIVIVNYTVTPTMTFIPR